jgi:hypothetical protein
MEHGTSRGETSIERVPYADLGGSYTPDIDTITRHTPARPMPAMLPGPTLLSWAEPAVAAQTARDTGRIVLALASLAIGFAGAVLLQWPIARRPVELAIVFGLTLGIAIGYSILGSGAMWFFALLRRWGFAGRVPRLERDTAMLLAAAWPLALVYALTVYVVHGLFERLF